MAGLDSQTCPDVSSSVVFETIKAGRREIIKYACFWDRDLKEPI